MDEVRDEVLPGPKEKELTLIRSDSLGFASRRRAMTEEPHSGQNFSFVSSIISFLFSSYIT